MGKEDACFEDSELKGREPGVQNKIPTAYVRFRMWRLGEYRENSGQGSHYNEYSSLVLVEKERERFKLSVVLNTRRIHDQVKLYRACPFE
mgnify:CR=1 FL=1